MEASPEAIAALRRDLESVSRELTAQVAALSEAVVPETTDEPETEAPPAERNEAEPEKKSGPLGGLRKALHRLL
jgi:hypothetical protein